MLLILLNTLRNRWVVGDKLAAASVNEITVLKVVTQGLSILLSK